MMNNSCVVTSSKRKTKLTRSFQIFDIHTMLSLTFCLICRSLVLLLLFSEVSSELINNEMISSSDWKVFKIVVNVKVSDRVVEIKSFETISKAQKSKRSWQLMMPKEKLFDLTCVPRYLHEVISFTDINRLMPAIGLNIYSAIGNLSNTVWWIFPFSV